MFHISNSDDIKEGKITDVYFERTVRILKKKRLDKRVVVEVRTRTLPSPYQWAILAGLDEALYLLEGLKVDVWSMPEGGLFYPFEPVLTIEGNYSEFGRYETALLGLICQASGIATRAARCKKSSQGKTVYHFGARRMHPGITSMIDRASFIGGCDGVAVRKSAEELGEKPVGTIPHALILLVGDTVKATQFFDEVIEPKVGRVALIDTLGDEKFEALRVAKVLGKNLLAVRIDTPASRRGDIMELLEEVRWELDLRGFKKVKIFVSGGITEEKIALLSSVADAFGVGTYISNAPVIDFSLDIVEINSKPLAKKGKRSGKKRLWQCPSCLTRSILPFRERIVKCSCGENFAPLTKQVIKEGRIVTDLPSPQEIKQYVLEQLTKIS
ncbi:Nicotinate phosphoribosyltransferase pncB2 [subsurface metagenome]